MAKQSGRNLTQAQRAALNCIIARLSPDNPFHAGIAPSITETLKTECPGYWADTAALARFVLGHGYHGEADHIMGALGDRYHFARRENPGVTLPDFNDVVLGACTVEDASK